jgi:nucleotide-binding universal stress UspA family protein
LVTSIDEKIMKTILIPLDFSPASKQAFQYAMGVAAHFESKVIILHVHSAGEFEPFVPVLMQQALLNDKKETALTQLQMLQLEVSEDLLARVSCEMRVMVGPVVEQIDRCAEEIDADLIVMGMRGGNRPGQKLWGSTTTRLIRMEGPPILAVPEHAVFQGIKRIAYATNFQQGDIRAVDSVIRMSHRLGAKVHCVHIDEIKLREEQKLKENILREAYQDELVMDRISVESLNGTSIEAGLQAYVQASKIDLMVMLTHARSLMGSLFHASQTRSFAIQSSVPVLAIKSEWIPNDHRSRSKQSSQNG